MEIIYPAYYEKFHCIAGACPDTCCKEWDVEVDPQSVARYRELEGTLGDTVRKNLYEEDGHTYLAFPQGRCPLQRGDGLCGLQAEHGEAMLCEVCRRFPRLTQDYGSFVELGLEMSCPEAARLIVTGEDAHLVHRQEPGGEEGEYDHEAMEVLLRTRERALQILADRAYPVNERLALLLLWAYQAQAELDGGEAIPFDPRERLEAARSFARPGDIGAVAEFYRELEILTERWKRHLEHLAAQPCWFEGLGRFAAYGVWRYWLQAVCDYDLIGRVKMVVIGGILAAYLAEEDQKSQINLLQLYSKEIENDAENTDALMDGAYTHPALTDRRLLGLLLSVSDGQN